MASAKRVLGWRSRPWTTARKLVQYLALLIFLALFIGSRKGGLASSLVNIPMRLDPLAMLAHLLSSRTFLAGSALAILTVLLTLGLGRAWCGWLCPLGTLLDLFPLDRARRALAGGQKKVVEPSENWRRVKYALLIAILTAALFGNLTLLVFDPLTILIRSLTTSLWPALDKAFTALEAALYPLPWFQDLLYSLDNTLRPALLPTAPVFYRDALLYGAVFFGVIGLNVFAPRFWCRYICPLGALLGLLSKVAIVRRKVGDECKACVLCTKACPTGTIRPEKDFASDPGECTVCMECMEACPRSGIGFGLAGSGPFGALSLAAWEGYDPGRREALATFGAAILGVALFRSELAARRDSATLIRPPGARENNILDKCIRCGECMRACPTSALQPAVSEAGLEGLWTPVLMLRLGYCEYSCNACGQACPVQAIPPLSLEDKRQQVIGKAYIDQNRCIAWADHRDCIVCEEMCPLPEKAITLDVAEVKNFKGKTVSIQLPKVDRDSCIGCGICEYKCPVNGEAAIRVFAPPIDSAFS